MGDGKQQTARKDGIYSLKDARKKVYTLGSRQLQNLGIKIRNFFAVELNKDEEEIDLLLNSALENSSCTLGQEISQENTLTNVNYAMIMNATQIKQDLKGLVKKRHHYSVKEKSEVFYSGKQQLVEKEISLPDHVLFHTIVSYLKTNSFFCRLNEKMVKKWIHKKEITLLSRLSPYYKHFLDVVLSKLCLTSYCEKTKTYQIVYNIIHNYEIVKYASFATKEEAEFKPNAEQRISIKA